MQGCRHNDNIVMNRYDLGGVLNVLAGRVGSFYPPADLDERSYHAGAYNALYAIFMHEWRDQTEFFMWFDALLDQPMEVGDGQD